MRISKQGDFLVTGASGFIGGHLVETLLDRGHTVRCLVRKSSQITHLRDRGAQLFVGDMREPDSLKQAVDGVGVVFHLAGVTSVFSTSELTRVNRDGTANLARVCAESPQPPVHIYVSSVAAAGPAELDQPRREEQPPQPISNYGRSKRDAELAAEQYAHIVPTSVVRPGIVFGPRNRETLPIFKTIARFRMHPVVGARTPPLSLIHVEDLVEILLHVADSGQRIAKDAPDRPGQGYYFACAPEYPNYAEWGAMVKSALQRPLAPTIPLVGPLPWIAAGANELIARVRGRPDSFNLDKIREAKAPLGPVRVAPWHVISALNQPSRCRNELRRQSLGTVSMDGSSFR